MATVNNAVTPEYLNAYEAVDEPIQPAYLAVLRREGAAKTLWRAARTKGPRRRSLLYV